MTTLRLGIAGLGHVGSGLVYLIEKQDTARLPGRLEVAGISARSRSRKRKVDVSDYAWFDDPVELARSSDIDVFVELMGGSDGPAKLAVEAALMCGKHVVTANKALIAEHGNALHEKAKARDVELLFEAAVAGGIPVVRALRESLSGVAISRVSGILNGTCNYLLTEMLASARSYDEVLADAQRLGYAEADPFLDVSGTDAAHRAAILSAIAFSSHIDFSQVAIEGVDRLDLPDLQLADRLGFVIKLLAEGRMVGGQVACSVAPKALSKSHPLATIGGALNTVRIESEALGSLVMTGPGAGAGPTASAVIGDVSRLFLGRSEGALGAKFGENRFGAGRAAGVSQYFVRVQLRDRSGALAALSNALAQSDVSVDKLIQDSAVDGVAPIALTTHPCAAVQISSACDAIAALDVVEGRPHVIQIEAAS